MRDNVRIGILVLLLPAAVFGLGFYVVASGISDAIEIRDEQTRQAEAEDALNLAAWDSFSALFEEKKFEPARQFAYYRVQPGETADSLPQHFSVPKEKLTALNPGPILPGRTIKVPPVEAPLAELPVTPLAGIKATVTDADGIVVVESNTSALTVMTVPSLAAYLQPQGVLTEVAPRHWRLEKPLYLNKNFRLDITDQTIDTLELRSEPGLNAALIVRRGEILIRNVTVRSIDTVSQKVDEDTSDGRSYIKAGENSRMDVIGSDLSYLGASFAGIENLLPGAQGPPFGVTWRNAANEIGTSLVTGWVQGSSFHHNYFGTYTFGVSGMYWGQNHFYQNLSYGLDPHDDSNNALIEGNTFEDNGLHGFIVSQRCNNNIIRNNVSFSNDGHGFMIHEGSRYNLLEGNEAYDNEDNIAIFNSDYVMIRDNRLHDARRTNIRVNNASDMTYILGNDISGGGHGIYIYDNTSNTYIRDNRIVSGGAVLRSGGGSTNLIFAGNRVGKEDYRFLDLAGLGVFVDFNEVVGED